jgi:hypothetical protein
MSFDVKEQLDTKFHGRDVTLIPLKLRGDYNYSNDAIDKI